MAPTDEDYAELTTAILGLVSHRFDHFGTDYREGDDCMMEGIDDEAIEIAKAWVEKHCTTTLDTVVHPLGTATIADSVCTCHQRDMTFVCEYCQAQGARKGHMQ